MTLSKLERWKIDFQKVAEMDCYARLRRHLSKLDLPDRPDLLLEGTIQSVDAAAVFSTFNRKSIIAFIDMQSYDGKASDDATFGRRSQLTKTFQARALTGKCALPQRPWKQVCSA